MKKNLIILFMIVFYSITGQALNFSNPSVVDFEYTSCSFEPEAKAVILKEDVHLTTQNNVAVFDIKRRFKVLKQEGINEVANVEIPFSKSQRILRLKAVTINEKNGEKRVIKVENDDFFEIDINEFWKAKRFTFPSVEVGSILDLSYDLETENLYFLDECEMQHEWPTLESRFRFTNNSYYGYTSIFQGKKMVEFAKKNDLKNTTFLITNVPSCNSIDYVFNNKDYIEKVSFQISSHPTEKLINNWKELVKEKLGF